MICSLLEMETRALHAEARLEVMEDAPIMRSPADEETTAKEENYKKSSLVKTQEQYKKLLQQL